MKLKLKLIINILCIIMLLGTTIFLIVYWKHMPDVIPMHYNLWGEVDGQGNKASIIVLPIVNWIMFGVISIAEMCPGAWNTGVRVTPQNSARIYRILSRLIIAIKIEVVALFSFITINSALSNNMPIKFVPITLILMFGTIIISLISLYRNR